MRAVEQVGKAARRLCGSHASYHVCVFHTLALASSSFIERSAAASEVLDASRSLSSSFFLLAASSFSSASLVTCRIRQGRLPY